MIELQFINYLINLSKKFDPNKHKYFPDEILRDKYSKNLSKKFNIKNNLIINVNINLLHDENCLIEYLKKNVKKIKKIKKKFVLCPTIVLSNTFSHSYLIVYYKNIDKFYICDSYYDYYNINLFDEFNNRLKKIYDNVFEDKYEKISYCLQNLEENNNYIKYLKNEYSNGYCLAWTYILCHLIIQYHWIELTEMIESIKWNLEFSSRFARQTIRGFIVHNIQIMYNNKLN